MTKPTLPLTLEQYLMGRDKLAPPNSDQLEHAKVLIARINLLLTVHAPELAAHYTGITSGYRPPVVNNTVARPLANSTHVTCEGVDLADPFHFISVYLAARPDILEKAGLYMETPAFTKTWAHLQTRPTHNRVYQPY